MNTILKDEQRTVGDALSIVLQLYRLIPSQLATAMDVPLKDVTGWCTERVKPAVDQLPHIAAGLDKVYPRSGDDFLTYYLGRLVSRQQ